MKLSDRSHVKVVKPWGYEEIFENNEQYCGKLLTVGDRWSSNGKFHFHQIKDETFFVNSGILILDIITNYREVISVPRHKRHVHFDIQEKILYPGMSERISPFTPHRFKSNNASLAKFIEVSTHSSVDDNHYIDSNDFSLGKEPI